MRAHNRSVRAVKVVVNNQSRGVPFIPKPSHDHAHHTQYRESVPTPAGSKGGDWRGTISKAHLGCTALESMEKLQLSDLHHGVDYPMACEEDGERCRIHVKMTEISMKSVEALIHSEKVRPPE